MTHVRGVGIVAHVQAVVSVSAAARLRAAQQFIDGFPPHTERLIVGATREAADDLARQVTVSRGGTLGIHRVSLNELITRIALTSLADAGLTIATTLGLEAIAARVIAEALHAGELKYMRPIADRPGFSNAMLRTLRDVRMAGLNPSALEHAPRTGPDLAILASRLDRALRASRAADLPTLLQLAIAALSRGDRVEVDARPTLLLDVPIRSTLEQQFLLALAGRTGPLLITIADGDVRTRRAAKRARAAFIEPQACSDTAPDLSRLQVHLFRDTSWDEHAEDPIDAVEVFSAPGEGREAVEVARRVLREAQRGVPFDRMAIVLRAPGVYGNLVETALARAGVPAWFTKGTQRPDPAGRAFVLLLTCATEGFSARRFAEYLSLGQVPRADGDTPPWTGPDDELVASMPPAGEAAAGTPVAPETPERPKPTPWRWERLLNDAAVVGGAARWRRRLDGLARELDLKVDELARDEPDAPGVRALRRDIQDLGHVRAFALPIIDVLEAWPRTALWGDWLPRLEALAPRVLTSPERVLGVLAALRPMAGVGPLGLGEVIAVLRERLTNLAPRPPRSRFGRILVCTPDAIRGRHFDAVFVPGLSERVFPERIRQDPLLLDAARADLNARFGADLQTGGDLASEERLRLRLAVGAATARLYLSYATVELASTRERLPSLYALDLCRSLTGTLPDHERLARLAAAASGARLAWPAPQEPQEAIDAIEHDLASLQRLLRVRHHEGRKGRARYLLDVHPALGRSLRARYLRNRAGWTSHDGGCFDDDHRQLLAPHRLRERPYSVSALQRFAACPYQFYLAAIMRLSARLQSETVHVLDPLTRGRLIHETLAACVRELVANNLSPRSVDDRRAALDVLDRVFDEVSSHYYDALAPVVERLWLDEMASIRTDLHGWLINTAHTAGEWVALHVELGFGFGPQAGRDVASRKDPIVVEGGWQLHGVIDLLEQRSDGSLRITDYKTGRHTVAAGTVVGGGAVLQPVLYALAAEALLSRPVHESRLLFCTGAGRYTAHSVEIGPAGSRAREAAQEVFQIVDRALEQGFLPPAPREGTCARCDFVSVCGPHEERRTARKDRKPLQDLEHLRRMR